MLPIRRQVGRGNFRFILPDKEKIVVVVGSGPAGLKAGSDSIFEGA